MEALIQKEIQQLASTLNLTDLEKDEYILTKEEEEKIIANAIEQKKKHAIWKWRHKGVSENEILFKLSRVDWSTQINRDSLLAFSNSCKLQDIWHNEQQKKGKEAIEAAANELRKRCDAQYMFRQMQWTSINEFGKKLIVNDDNKFLIKTLCFFCSDDERFETELGLSKNKGLLIRGISGIGKTHLVKCLEKNELNRILVLSMIEIAEVIKQEGEYRVEMGLNKIIYLDDVGTEEATINHYGTKINFFKNFIEHIYLRNKGFNKLIISTNNSFSEIEEKYGFRVRSRIKDMFNIIDVSGKDMRG